MIPPEKIIVALDFSDEQKLLSFFDMIKGHNVWVKVGMELFYSMGPKVIHEAKDRGYKVFLDHSRVERKLYHFFFLLIRPGREFENDLHLCGIHQQRFRQ
jgi:hypothetical protein